MGCTSDKQMGAWKGAGGELMGRDSIWLSYCGSMAGIGLAQGRASTGVLFIRWDY